MCWEKTCIGLTHKALVYQGSQLQKTFAELAEPHEVNAGQTDTQSHNSLRIGERYHVPLRNTFCKLTNEYSGLRDELVLAFTKKDINDTRGSECVLLSALVYGEFLSFHTQQRTCHAVRSLNALL